LGLGALQTGLDALLDHGPLKLGEHAQIFINVW
jgi:hypothetical protein